MRIACRFASLVLAVFFLTVSLVPGLALASGRQATYTVTINYLKTDTYDVVAQPYVATVGEGFEDEVTVPSPKVKGYEPDKPSVHVKFSELTGDKTITVFYSPSGVEYTIKYYKTQLDGTVKEDVSMRATKTAKVGATVVAQDPHVPGFSAAQPLPEGVIPADGELVLEMTLVRGRYTITFDTDGGSKISPITRYFGETYPKPSDPVKKNSVFAGWSVPLPDTMPGHDLTVTARWDSSHRPTATYKIYVQNTTDDDYSLVYTGKAAKEPGETYGFPTDAAGVNALVETQTRCRFPELKDKQNLWSFAYTFDVAKTRAAYVEANGSEEPGRPGTDNEIPLYFNRNVFTFNFMPKKSEIRPHDRSRWFALINKNNEFYGRIGDAPSLTSSRYYSITTRFGTKDLSKKWIKDRDITNL